MLHRTAIALAAALLVQEAVAAQAPRPAPAEPPTIIPVQGNVYMVAGADTNATLQIGKYGPLLVDTPAAAQVPALLAEMRKLTSQAPRLFLHTTAAPDYLAGDDAFLSGTYVYEGLLHNALYDRLLPTPTGRLLPESTITYTEPMVDSYNSEPIILYQVPAAITDADTIIHFRTSDVISTGPIYTPGRYPVIDIERGGTINGLIDAVYKVLEIAVSDNLGDRGTVIIPGRGRLAEESDVAEYRNMLVIVTDRIRDMRGKGMSLERVKASRPSLDYDGWFHATQADADRFVESIYKTLPQDTRQDSRR